MSISSYSELKSSIADFLNRDDLTSVIPTFISLAEAQMNRDLRHWRMEERSTATLDTQYSALPDDWLQTISLSLDNQRLEYVSRDNMLELAEKTSIQTGATQYYTLVGGELEFYPRPADSSTMTLIYVQKIPALSDSTATNWVLDTFPEVYLYGSLLHSAPYLHDDARVQTWGGLYAAAAKQVNDDGARAKSGTNMRLRVKGLS
jgi:hypothetical protein